MNKTLHTPMYIQISQEYKNKIINNYYEINQQIPTEDEIAKKFGVSRMTARNAVTRLVMEGLVYRVHGKGAFVVQKKIERSLNKITGFHEDMVREGLNPVSKIIKFEKRYPNDEEAHKLRI